MRVLDVGLAGILVVDLGAFYLGTAGDENHLFVCLLSFGLCNILLLRLLVDICGVSYWWPLVAAVF